MNKDGICLLGSRPIDPKQRIRKFSNTDMKLKCQKYCENSCVVCISTVCILKCVSHTQGLAKAKHLVLNKCTKVGKRCFNLSREANYRPQGAFEDWAEEGISVVMFVFLSIFSLGLLLLFIAQ